jgi:hypothetical protein
MLHKRYTAKKIVLLTTLLTLLLTFVGCSSGAETNAGSESASDTADVDGQYVSYEIKKSYTDASWSDDAATSVVFSDSGVSVNGSGATAGQGTGSGIVTIDAAGTYVISGSSDDAQIFVYAGKKDKVRIVLNGVNLTNDNGSVIYAKRAKLTSIILADGSDNVIADGSEYTGVDEDGEPDATIFSKNDLSITGGGSLSVDANYGDAIASKDVLCVADGNIEIDAADDGIRGTDGLVIAGGNIEIRAERKGVRSTKDTDDNKGFVLITGGTLNIPECYEGIEAPQIQIDGGDITIVASDDGINGASNTDTTGTHDEDIQGEDATDADAAPEFIKPDGAPDEDLGREGGGMRPPDGTMPERTPPSGTMPDGTTQPEIPDGTSPVPDTDTKGSWDGVIGGAGQGQSGASDYVFVRITGGALDITGQNDGIDVNGNLYIDGGTIKVSGPARGMDGAIDLDGTLTRTGGELDVTGTVSAMGDIVGWEVPEENTTTQGGNFGGTRGGRGDTI